jgi:hypothetical protein
MRGVHLKCGERQDEKEKEKDKDREKEREKKEKLRANTDKGELLEEREVFTLSRLSS